MPYFQVSGSAPASPFESLKKCLTLKSVTNIIDMMFTLFYSVKKKTERTTFYRSESYTVDNKEVPDHENDISAEEKIQSKSSRIQSKNEHCQRKKGTRCQKSKRKKSIISIGRRFVAFSSIRENVGNLS